MTQDIDNRTLKVARDAFYGAVVPTKANGVRETNYRIRAAAAAVSEHERKRFTVILREMADLRASHQRTLRRLDEWRQEHPIPIGAGHD